MILNNKITGLFNSIIIRLSHLANYTCDNRKTLRQIDEKLDTILAALPKVQSFNDNITDDLK